MCIRDQSIPSAVATLRKVTPVQASKASRSMSPEQASPPSPPVAGCSPARTGPAQVAAVQVMPGSSNPNPALACRGCLLYTSDAADDLTRVDLGGPGVVK